MEYSYEFDLDYSNIDSRKYYAGPSNYYGKRIISLLMLIPEII